MTTPDRDPYVAAYDALDAPGAVPAAPSVPDADALRELELWSVLDWSLWGNGLGDVLRTSMADAMVAALSDEQREQAEACIKSWHERRGPSMAVGVGTRLQQERDALSLMLRGMARRAVHERQMKEQACDAVVSRPAIPDDAYAAGQRAQAEECVADLLDALGVARPDRTLDSVWQWCLDDVRRACRLAERPLGKSVNSRQAMLARRAEVMAANPAITDASDLAPLMGDMQGEYWGWCLERYLLKGEDHVSTDSTRIPAGDDTFANPWLACAQCRWQVTHVVGPPLTNQPCGHAASVLDLCPSWGPVDGCTCASVGIEHDAPQATAEDAVLLAGALARERRDDGTRHDLGAVIAELAPEGTAEPTGCPDGGTCHHTCTKGCFRVIHAAPLSGVYPDDRWPADLSGLAAHPDTTEEA